MPAAAIGLGAVGNIIGGIMQQGSINDAMKQIQQLTGKAIGAYQDYGNQALGKLGDFWNTQQQNESPYLKVGAGAIGDLSAALQPGGELSGGYGQQFQAPTEQQVEQTPGYQFQLQQGQQAIERSAAAKGSLLNGGTAKALDNYSQGLASTTYQNAYDRALQSFGTNYNIWNTDRNNQFNRLAGLSGFGASSAASLNQNAGNMANLYNANLLSTGGEIGSAYQNEAQGLASLLMNKGNVQAGMANGLGGAFGNYLMMSKFLQ